MNYCILRLEKLKTLDEVDRSARHTFREIPTRNADPRRTHLNKTWGAQTAAEVCDAIEDRLPKKRRKDAVTCIEYLVTASPEFFKTAPRDKQNRYFAGAREWLEKRHGKENIVCVNMQLDETSPHMVVYVVPITKDGRLSAKELVGNVKALQEMQTNFAETVGKPVGLQRGVEGSRAVHTTVRQFYTALDKKPDIALPKPPAPLPQPTIADRLSGRAKEAEAEQEKAEEEYQRKLAAEFAEANRLRSVALVSGKAREAQAKAIEEQRKKAAALEAEKKKAEQDAAAEKARADRLAREKRRLIEEAEQREQEFSAERSMFQATIHDLRSALNAALAQVSRLKEYIAFWKRRLFPTRKAERDDERDSGPNVRP